MPYPTGVALRELSRISEKEKRDAGMWWQKYAPPHLEALLLAGQFDTETQIPQTEEEFEQWLVDYYGRPSTPDERRRKKRLRRLWTVGALFFFARGVYYNRFRQKIAWINIRLSLDDVLSRAMPDIERDCLALREGKMKLPEWESRMTDWIKQSHIAAAVAQAGGFDNMTPDLWQQVENMILFQLEHLRDFSRQIAAGLPLDGNICRRMRMYIEAARATYHNLEAGMMARIGFTLYASIRTANESCNQCVEEEARGFVPVGELTPIGARECLSHCKCYFIYMDPETGQVDERR